VNKNAARTALWIFVVVTILSPCAFAEEGAGSHAEGGVPRIVLYQALNFFGLLIILFFVVKNKVGGFFAKRHETLTLALNEAKKQKQEAEKRHQEYVIKIQNLERDATVFIDQIKKDAEESKKRIIEEAIKLVEVVRQEAKRSAENEIEKAKAQLYDEVLQQSLDGARGLLGESIAENDQRRLQKEFVEKIEAVQ